MHVYKVALVVSDSLKHYGLYPPGSSVHGIIQARILEWVAMPSPEDLPEVSHPHLLHVLHWQAGSSSLAPPGTPSILVIGDLFAEREIISKFSNESSLLYFH